MKHAESKTKVYQTSDYNAFGLIKGNRELDMNKIKKILADIERGTNLLQYCPILVVDREGKLDIVDGQHRFVVSKKTKSPVFYVLAEELSLYDIARLNSNTEKWKARDFINCYCEMKNPHYKQLAELLKEYPGVAVTSAVSLLGAGRLYGGGAGAKMDAFQRGEFKVEHEKHARTLLKTASDFNHPDKYSRSFMIAIEKVITAGVYQVQQLVERVNADPSALQHHENQKKYLINLEEIANKGKQKRVAIY